MRFKVGDSVRVKKGVKCPDDDSVSLAGWQGRIFEIEDRDLIGVRWDSITLKQMPREYIQQSEEEGTGWAEMYLSVDDLEPASARDSKETADQVRQEVESTSSWFGDGEEGQRILQVIENAEDEVEAWHDHLAQVLTFPFDAEVSEPQDRGRLDYGDKVRVHGISDADDLYGVLVSVTHGRNRFVFPLCDLTVQDKKSPNYRPVKDYCVWFANQ